MALDAHLPRIGFDHQAGTVFTVDIVALGTGHVRVQGGVTPGRTWPVYWCGNPGRPWTVHVDRGWDPWQRESCGTRRKRRR